jgi:CoA:oxalate CoA-transferase
VGDQGPGHERGDRRDEAADQLPLAGLLVLDFGQFLAGPVAALRLADLGARVIKVERPGTGDAGRGLAFGSVFPDGDGLSFHIMNRNKASIAADLKDPADLAFVKGMVARADVLIHNFRPGVMERYGLGYADVRTINPGLVYATVSGYGNNGPWRDKPGQDLLAQARSGLLWLTGRADDPPMPVGVSVADQLAAHVLAEGILAALVGRARTGRGCLVETSLLEAVVDLQFEFVAARLNAPAIQPTRPRAFGAHQYLSSPYGVYPTADGYLAVAMNPVSVLGQVLDIPELAQATAAELWWQNRDSLNAALAERLQTASTSHWLALLEPAGIWCAPVLTLDDLLQHEAFAALDMVQTVQRGNPPVEIRTTRLPLRLNGHAVRHVAGAPRLGQDTERIRTEFGVPPTG